MLDPVLRSKVITSFMRNALRHIMLVFMMLGFVAQSALAVNAAGAMICCDPEMKAIAYEQANNMVGSDMSGDLPCHDTEFSCETCCMDAVSQNSLMDRVAAISMRSLARDKSAIQSDQIPNSFAPDYISPPPNA